MRRQDPILIANKTELARALVASGWHIKKVARQVSRSVKWVLSKTVDIRNPELDRPPPPRRIPKRLKGDASASTEMPHLSDDKQTRDRQIADCLAFWRGE